MRGKGGSSLECSCGWGCASDFELQRAGAEKKRRNKKLPAQGNQTLSFASDFC